MICTGEGEQKITYEILSCWGKPRSRKKVNQILSLETDEGIPVTDGMGMRSIANTASVPNYKTILRIFFILFYKRHLLFSTTLIISLHTNPYLLYIFFFNRQ